MLGYVRLGLPVEPLSNTKASFVLPSYLESCYTHVLALKQRTEPLHLLPCGLFVRFVTAVREAAAIIQILWLFVVTQQYVLDLILVSF